MPKKVERGYLPEDKISFSDSEINRMQIAQSDILYLLDHDYSMESAVRFVGDHFQFSLRQRTALTRSSCTTKAQQIRKQKQKTGIQVNETLYVDGFNLVILLEAALTPRSTLLVGMDNTLRDLCGLRGTYRIIENTAPGIQLFADYAYSIGIEKIVIYLDKMISNSGRLRQLYDNIITNKGFQLETHMVPNADALLWDKPNVVSSDSAILDRCISWRNIAYEIVMQSLPTHRLIYLNHPQ